MRPPSRRAPWPPCFSRMPRSTAVARASASSAVSSFIARRRGENSPRTRLGSSPASTKRTLSPSDASGSPFPFAGSVMVEGGERLLRPLDAPREPAVLDRPVDLVPGQERVRQAVERRLELGVVAQDDVLHLGLVDPV